MEFARSSKIHCDNIGFDLTATNFPALEIAVQTWQRSSTTGKQFTAGCLPASQGNKNVNVSSLEIKDQWEEDNEKLAIMDAQTNSYQVSLASARGQRGGRGGRGAGRGARGQLCGIVAGHECTSLISETCPH